MGKLSEKIAELNSLQYGPSWDDVDFPRLFDEWHYDALELESDLLALVRYHRAKLSTYEVHVTDDWDARMAEYAAAKATLSDRAKRMLEE